MAELCVTLADGQSWKHQLADVPTVIGRDPSCDITVDDVSVSRRHALVRPNAGGYCIEDLGSKNGTLVNNVPISSALLADDDVIMVGVVRLVYSSRDPDQTTTSVVLVDQEPQRASASFSSPRDQLSLPLRRLHMLYELSGRLTSLRDGASLLDETMDICFETLRFERGAIAILQPGRRTVDWPIVRNLRGTHGELTISRTILGRALDHGERSIVNEGDSGTFDPTVSMVQHGIRSALCVPLIHYDEILGVIYGDRVSTGTVYSDEDVDFLAGLAQQVSIGLINSRLMEEQKLKVRLENEIALAREIQQALFPADLPDHDRFKAAALNAPGRHVSGDYYDLIELPDGRLMTLIADVTGEGMAASLLMANLQAAVRVTLLDLDDLSEMLTRWNRLIYGNTDASKFITCLVAILDPHTRTLHLASAGHPLPDLVTLQPPSCRSLEVAPGLPLGVLDDAQYTSVSLALGDAPCTLFYCTDGVFEAMDPDRRQFSLERMHDVLAGCESIDPQQIIGSMWQAIKDFVGSAPQSDDITMMAVHLPCSKMENGKWKMENGGRGA
ncbi:MAG: SpoIIE family protein phosphatase [Phycisphaerae bacterium]|nr:SpoIIE family protein phosphatase [Phycisphaerae bacterium]